ncbi:uncharacterized protein LOC111087209 [Limulus polyphemus]|uniref:Uncharacterized protein LOC111087209 n=1 Tax=Limulus polyphemus TaxID=6850 RepID=A0ABM1SYU0_LIMPO|nr:uncharacterized protein LOC111087209 [Limulus polyphemus]XP_022248797.1 uncharacterized protein LOC111087209 [Limulus polyphemus]XP_022248798.1 uncharacterized protein LOC111087209 [Limulus polyphemus]
MAATFTTTLLLFSVGIVLLVETASITGEKAAIVPVIEENNNNTTFLDIKHVQSINPGSVNSPRVWIKFEEFVNKAKTDPSFLELLIKILMKLGFSHKEVQDLLTKGITSWRGTNITLQDVSKFCCPLGI